MHGHNNSEGQSMSSPNTKPENRYVNYDSQWQSPSISNTDPRAGTIHNRTNVPSPLTLEGSSGAGSRPVHGDVRLVNDLDRTLQHGDNWVFVNHPENVQEGIDAEDKGRLSSTSQDTTNYTNTDGYDLKQIDLIYLKLFTKRKSILDNILHCFSQSGYHQGLSFNEDGSIEPPLNNQEYFALNVAINKFLDIKKVLIKQYDLPDGWVDSMNVIENNIVVERRELNILIVGLKHIVQRVLANLRQYTRKADVSTEGFQQKEPNLAVVDMEYLCSYHIGINCPLDCEYICKAGDQLLFELQKKYRCFIETNPLITGTKEIHIANWSYDKTTGCAIKIPLIIGDYRTLPDKSDMLVLEQNQAGQCHESGKQISDNLAHYRIMPDSSKHDLEEVVKKGRYKTLILLVDKTTQKTTVSSFIKACKTLTKKIYFPIESRPQINRHLLKNLLERGKLEYGGQGHYIEMKIGQINNQKVDVIVDVVESQPQSNRYDIKEIKTMVGALQYRLELNIPSYSSDFSTPIFNLSFLVMKCLRRASKKNMTSIAFPVLGVGSLGYPIQLVARSMMETIDEYFRCKNETSLCRVMIVIHGGDTSSKEAFFRVNLARIKEGKMKDDTVYKVNIEITGDKTERLRIGREIEDIITKKEVVFNDISDPINEAPCIPINWKKGELLGKGGFGEVYKCYDMDTGCEYAVKIVQLGNLNAKAPKEVRALENELNLLKSFKDERIVQYYGCQNEDKVLSIFIEYMPGGSVKDLINEIGRIQEPLVRKYSRQVLLGLSYLHKNDIVHRDIKAANILRDTQGNVKLGDFGASKRLEKLRSASGLKTYVGTPYWMAPEVIKSEGYGRKADIWSVGCTIVEMFSTKPPFHEYETFAAIFQIGNCKHPKYELPKDVTDLAKEFLALAFQITQGDRPSADDLLKHGFVQDRT
ncbi:uncharacterized protein LOC126821892 isoform X2 [Patella vulgata]|uniref:uncharacterized protein LOC126821892 isoform X2 n=1 Tax=Patella vulgata TaxID=6465 RepID=UPI0024A8D2C7|nr:uncharacterized protein LOC126821892 isoform X2 [Patella vulgata]